MWVWIVNKRIASSHGLDRLRLGFHRPTGFFKAIDKLKKPLNTQVQQNGDQA
jgi:hypothetical protein